MPRDDLYLLEIIEATDHVRAFLAGVDDDVWADSELLRSAVLQKLLVIGEAVRGLTVDVKTRHPNLPWPHVVAFRNVAVHEYFAVEWPEVWHIAQHELPTLREQVLDVLRAEFPEVARRYEERG